MRRKSPQDHLKWPRPDQKVDLFHALVAIALGNAPILARYLLESDHVAPGVTRLIAFMLDPSRRSFQPDEDGDDDGHWCATWRLDFNRIGSGNRKNGAEVNMSLMRIGFFFAVLIQDGVKPEAACQDTMEKFSISRASAYSALKLARTALQTQTLSVALGLPQNTPSRKRTPSRSR
jgi:hypothetical protein